MGTKPELKLSGNVGRKNGVNAANNPADVRLVQTLLQKAAQNLRNSAYAPQAVTGAITAPPGESSTVQAIVAFQHRFLSKPDGLIEAGGMTWKKLVEAAGGSKPKTLRIIEGRNFKALDNKVVLSALLRQRVTELCTFLIDEGLVTDHIVFTQGVRSPQTAHLWSTSWNIRQGRVPLKNLQALTDGKDLDGTMWYRKEWEQGLAVDKNGHLTKEATAQLWKKIKDNARTYYASDAVAAEGYLTSDKHILPNVHPVRSNHIFGDAMDVSISWKSGASFVIPGGKDSATLKVIDGKTSDSAANRLVAQFGLSRPVKSEKWHFQLAQTAAVNVSPANVTPGHPADANPHP